MRKGEHTPPINDEMQRILQETSKITPWNDEDNNTPYEDFDLAELVQLTSMNQKASEYKKWESNDHSNKDPNLERWKELAKKYEKWKEEEEIIGQTRGKISLVFGKVS